MNKKPWIIFTLFGLLLALIIPTPFMSDDWEHINSYLTGTKIEYISQYLYRNPGLMYQHLLLFPLFLGKGAYFIKFFTFFILGISGWLFLDIFISDFREKFNKNMGYMLLPYFISMAPNNYAWTFWPTEMTMIPSVLFISLFFWLGHRFKDNIWVLLLKPIFYTWGFLTFETLFTLFVLIELSYVIYFSEKFDLKKYFIYLMKNLAPALVLCVIAKVLQAPHTTATYNRGFVFRGHLFYQFITMTLNHDYYKIRWATGILSILLNFYLIFKGFKLTKSKLNATLISTVYFLSGSYYFFIMDYSARRALGGQIYFIFGLFTFLAFTKLDLKKKFEKAVFFLFLLVNLGHNGYIVSVKYKDQKAQNTIKQKIKTNTLTDHHYNALNDHYKTKWSIVKPVQGKAMIEFFKKYDL